MSDWALITSLSLSHKFSCISWVKNIVVSVMSSLYGGSSNGTISKFSHFRFFFWTVKLWNITIRSEIRGTFWFGPQEVNRGIQFLHGKLLGRWMPDDTPDGQKSGIESANFRSNPSQRSFPEEQSQLGAGLAGSVKCCLTAPPCGCDEKFRKCLTLAFLSFRS